MKKTFLLAALVMFGAVTQDSYSFDRRGAFALVGALAVGAAATYLVSENWSSVSRFFGLNEGYCKREGVTIFGKNIHLSVADDFLEILNNYSDKKYYDLIKQERDLSVYAPQVEACFEAYSRTTIGLYTDEEFKRRLIKNEAGINDRSVYYVIKYAVENGYVFDLEKFRQIVIRAGELSTRDGGWFSGENFITALEELSI